MTFDIIAQFMVVALSLMCCTLIASTDPKNRFYAALFGMCAGPFWLLTFLFNGQVGFVVLLVIYEVHWYRVAKNNYSEISNGTFLFSKDYFRFCEDEKYER